MTEKPPRIPTVTDGDRYRGGFQKESESSEVSLTPSEVKDDDEEEVEVSDY